MGKGSEPTPSSREQEDTMAIFQKNDTVCVGDYVHLPVVRAKDGSGCWFVASDTKAPPIRLRVFVTNLYGMADCFSLQFEDGAAVGLPFFTRDLVGRRIDRRSTKD